MFKLLKFTKARPLVGLLYFCLILTCFGCSTSQNSGSLAGKPTLNGFYQLQQSDPQAAFLFHLYRINAERRGLSSLKGYSRGRYITHEEVDKYIKKLQADPHAQSYWEGFSIALNTVGAISIIGSQFVLYQAGACRPAPPGAAEGCVGMFVGGFAALGFGLHADSRYGDETIESVLIYNATLLKGLQEGSLNLGPEVPGLSELEEEKVGLGVESFPVLMVEVKLGKAIFKVFGREVERWDLVRILDAGPVKYDFSEPLLPEDLARYNRGAYSWFRSSRPNRRHPAYW